MSFAVTRWATVPFDWRFLLPRRNVSSIERRSGIVSVPEALHFGRFWPITRDGARKSDAGAAAPSLSLGYPPLAFRDAIVVGRRSRSIHRPRFQATQLSWEITAFSGETRRGFRDGRCSFSGRCEASAAVRASTQQCGRIGVMPTAT
jgi:hypothetical protein